MPEQIAAYRLRGKTVEVWRGDAVAVPADVALFGRCKPLRSRLEAAAGRAFEPHPDLTVYKRRLDLLPIDRKAAGVPWRLAASLDYRPKRVSIDAKQTYPNLTHIDKLSDDIWWAVWMLLRRLPDAKNVLLLPLSCRNPEVVAVAAALAVWTAVRYDLPVVGGRKVRFRFIDAADPSLFCAALEDRDGMFTRALRAATEGMGMHMVKDWSDERFKPA